MRASSESAPTHLIASVPIVGWWRGDLGVTIGAGVALWSDQSTAGNHLAQVTASMQPSRSVINGQQALTFDGSNDFLLGTFSTPAANTTPRQYRMIGRVNTWTNNRALWGAGALGCQQCFMGTPTPDLVMYNGTATSCRNTNMVVGQARRIRSTFTGSTSDRLLIGSVTSAVNASTGVITATDWKLGSNGTASSESAITVWEMIITAGAISAGEETALQAYETARYGAGLH